jgi:hypothetical protein
VRPKEVKLREKEHRKVVSRDRGMREREGGQRKQTFSYKMNKF